VDTISLGDSSSEEDEAGLVQEVSLAKKRKIVQQWKEKQNIIKKANNFTRDEALCRRVQDLIGTRRTLATVTRACTCHSKCTEVIVPTTLADSCSASLVEALRRVETRTTCSEKSAGEERNQGGWL